MNAAGLDVVRPACRGTAPWMPPPFQAGVRTGERQRGARAAAEVRPTGTDTGSARSLIRVTYRKHDPFLAYSMASFNSGGGWKEFLLKASLQNT